ncbi:MAG: hypothetical protein Q9167_000059 [Letrouitia subvulpina]
MAIEKTFQTMKDDILSALVNTTRTTGRISNEDLSFQRSSNPGFGDALDQQSSRLLALSQGLMKFAVEGTKTTAPRLSNLESIDDNWRGVVDVIDNLLEKADVCLDEFTGAVQKFAPSSQNLELPPIPQKKSPSAREYRNRDIPKPQLMFEKVPKNDGTTPFKPLLRFKPHAVIPLEAEVPSVDNDGNILAYKNPYETEIQHYKYPDSVYVQSEPILYPPLETTKAIWVDTKEAVVSMLGELKNAREIAIDLEHHDAHSYVGLVSLMQISTRDQDWVVDTLQPWREDLQILNEVFADPKIVKVLHGSYMDIIWLQRDLGLYVVGLFDTFHAARLLKYPKRSLAYLLARFANFSAEKQYQVADWRIRPLPDPLFNYARSDTHFLLYIYDNLRNEVLAESDPSLPSGDLIGAVLESSKTEALQRYERSMYDSKHGIGASGWYNMLSRSPSLFNSQQFAVFRAVHQWRDTVAREEDEGLQQTMPKHVVFNIAREMPVTMPSLLGCAQPITPIVRHRAPDLLALIQHSKIEGATGPNIQDLIPPTEGTPSNLKIAPRERSSQDMELRKLITGGPETAASTGPNLGSHPTKYQSLYARPNSTSAPARLHLSQFWGPTLQSVTDGDTRSGPISQADNVRLALPLPNLTAEVLEVTKPTEIGMQPRIDQAARVEHQYTKRRRSDEGDIFVAKEAGGSRKRRAIEVQGGSNSAAAGNGMEARLGTSSGPVDESQLPYDNTDEKPMVLEQSPRKAEQVVQNRPEKESRKRKKLQQTNGTADRPQELEEETVFDYENAPSVLHAGEGRKGKKDEKKSFDPYSKSMDAPHGLKRVQRGQGGKSLTYTS